MTVLFVSSTFVCRDDEKDWVFLCNCRAARHRTGVLLDCVTSGKVEGTRNELLQPNIKDMEPCLHVQAVYGGILGQCRAVQTSDISQSILTSIKLLRKGNVLLSPGANDKAELLDADTRTAAVLLCFNISPAPGPNTEPLVVLSVPDNHDYEPDRGGTTEDLLNDDIGLNLHRVIVSSNPKRQLSCHAPSCSKRCTSCGHVKCAWAFLLKSGRDVSTAGLNAPAGMDDDADVGFDLNSEIDMDEIPDDTQVAMECLIRQVQIPINQKVSFHIA